MPVVHEFRIPLPLGIDEFRRGQLFMTAKAEVEAATGQEGVVVLKNEPYDNTDGHLGVCPITGTLIPRNAGIYTLKHYIFASKVPPLLKALAPASALYLIEVAWNCYPHCKTALVSGYLSKETLRIDVETLHVEGDLGVENAIGLTDAELRLREVEVLDIRSAAGSPSDPAYRAERDPSRFTSVKTGRGPLQEGWFVGAAAPRPFMVAYKVVRVHCSIFGLSSVVEKAVLGQQRGLFTQTHCKAFVTLDEWFESSLEDIRLLEDEAAAKSKAIMGSNAVVDPSKS